MTRSVPILPALAILALAVAGCGGDDGSAPAAGKTVELETAGGQVLTREPGQNTFATLDHSTKAPVGTEVDASKGTVKMTSAIPGGDTQSGEFSQGGFEVAQDPKSRVVTLLLRGGDSSKCKTAAARKDHSTVGGPVIRKLFVNAKGHFRTKGRFAAAAIRGTKFTATDACFGTLTDVKQGDVAVTNLTNGRQIQLKTGQRFWAAERP